MHLGGKVLDILEIQPPIIGQVQVPGDVRKLLEDVGTKARDITSGRAEPGDGLRIAEAMDRALGRRQGRHVDELGGFLGHGAAQLAVQFLSWEEPRFAMSSRTASVSVG